MESDCAYVFTKWAVVIVIVVVAVVREHVISRIRSAFDGCVCVYGSRKDGLLCVWRMANG